MICIELIFFKFTTYEFDYLLPLKLNVEINTGGFITYQFDFEFNFYMQIYICHSSRTFNKVEIAIVIVIFIYSSSDETLSRVETRHGS